MEFLTGITEKETLQLEELCDPRRIGTEVKTDGFVHSIRDMGEVTFVVLRERSGLIQCVFEEGVSALSPKELRESQTVRLCGMLQADERAPHGVEIRVKSGEILTSPYAPLPLPVGKWKLNTSLEAKLDNRSIALRNVRERAKFRIQEGIIRGFRDFLYSRQFTEIHTPKIGAKGAEGGSNLFRLDYFHHPAVLAMIKMAADNAHAEGKWIGICGELGADLELTEEFLKMGLDELSVSPAMVLPLRKRIRECE